MPPADPGAPPMARFIFLAREHHPWMLTALALALFCTSTLFNVPLWIMGIIGLAQVLRSPRRVVRDPDLALLGVLFLCLWVPQLTSLPDAVNLRRAAGTAAAYSHFYFAGVFAVQAFRAPAQRARLERAVLFIVTAWSVDALLQLALGVDLLGYPHRPGEITGMFYPDARLGHVLAVLAAISLDALREMPGGKWWRWLAGAVLFAAIFASGKRFAWFMALLAGGAWLIHVHVVHRRVRAAWIATGALAAVALVSLVLVSSPPLARRADAALGLFSGNAARVDLATAHRLPIWRTAERVFSDHWINGVGPRGFRYVYRDYAPANDFYLKAGRNGQAHPHQFVLEIGAETGSIGLLGFLAFWWLLVRASLPALRRRPECAPWLIAAAMAYLPLSAHMAFYGSYWSSVAWWILPVALAAGAGNTCRAS